MRKYIAVVLVVLAACAPRLGSEVLRPVVPATEPAQIVDILVVSTRRPNPAPALGFSAVPAFRETYRNYRFGFSTTEAPRVIAMEELSKPEFLRRTSVSPKAGDLPPIGVFVHGYNNNFQESLFGLAEIAVTSGANIKPILFAWPSEGHPLEYVADSQAALFSRDALAGLVNELTLRNDSVLLFGHSMGSALSLEAMRTLKLLGNREALDKLKVVLAAPDVDLFMFMQQMRIIGPMRTPMVVLVAPNDRALALSSRLSGGRPRLGRVSVDNPMVAAAAGQANALVLDISGLPSDPLNHSGYKTLVDYYRGMKPEDQLDLRTTGAFVLDTVERRILRPILAP